MKRTILLGIVGVAAAVATSAYGQGAIQLSNYINSSTVGNNPVMFGPGSGGTVGTAIGTGSWTVGFYIAPGTVSAGADATAGSGTDWGNAVPTSLNALFALASGLGSTAGVADGQVFNVPGTYASPNVYVAGNPGGTFTLMMVAYNGANYANSTIRGHSQAFQIVTSVGTAFPNHTGTAEADGGWQVSLVSVIPEPTTMALGGLGLAALMLFRRKQV